MTTEKSNEAERRCTNCAKAVDDAPYEAWLFHTCVSCAAERTPDRWGDGLIGPGTYRKWRYFPRYHMTRHPDLPEHVRQRHGGASA